MDKPSENALKKQMRPMIESHVKLLEQAIVLRVDVHILLAFEQGAEEEDIPDIICGAIETAIPITAAYFDSLGEVDKAHAFTKRKGG